jgi:hypothetical protein
MIVIICVVAYGTIIESLYNSDMARLKVYQTTGFSILTTILWFNILFAALSRWPWKKHHIGFLITHLGLLLLLLGGVMTSWYGIDGTLRIVEGQESNAVVLPQLVLGIAPQGASNYSFYPIKRSGSLKEASDFSSLNETISSVLTIDKMEPFVAVKNGYMDTKDSSKGPFAVEFRIKSAFFDVEQSLQSESQTNVSMGPAQFILKEERDPEASSQKTKLNANGHSYKKSYKKGNWLIVKDKSTGKELKKIEVKSELVDKTINVNNVKILISKVFKRASVGQGGMTESADGDPNPALVLLLESGSEKARDVVFTKYPSFSLNQKNDFGLRFEYQSSDLKAENIVDMASAQSMSPSSSNQIEFIFNRKKPDVIKLELSKQGKQVQTTEAKIADVVTTPWMGMQVTIKGLHWGAQMKNEVIVTEPELKSSFLPPSALLISPALSAPADQDWLVEGDEKSIVVNDKNFNIYFGRKVEFLPFKLKLGKFKKVDYPGTSMAKSFESLVTVSDNQKETLISMNEPLEHNGYTVYQSSYEEMPGGISASIFSVNKDPGRPFKYIGGIILAIGLIVFTLMRSRLTLKSN